MSRRIVLLLAAVLAVVTAGCGTESGPSGQENPVPPSPSTPSGTPSEIPPTGTPSETPSNGTPAPGGPDAAVQDLAKRTGVAAADISVVSAEEVTWSDSSMGCPEPGMMYAQVLTEGSRIVLEANGTRYEYHSGAGKPPFFCENPKPPVR